MTKKRRIIYLTIIGIEIAIIIVFFVLQRISSQESKTISYCMSAVCDNQCINGKIACKYYPTDENGQLGEPLDVTCECDETLWNEGDTEK